MTTWKKIENIIGGSFIPKGYWFFSIDQPEVMGKRSVIFQKNLINQFFVWHFTRLLYFIESMRFTDFILLDISVYILGVKLVLELCSFFSYVFSSYIIHIIFRYSLSVFRIYHKMLFLIIASVIDNILNSYFVPTYYSTSTV